MEGAEEDRNMLGGKDGRQTGKQNEGKTVNKGVWQTKNGSKRSAVLTARSTNDVP